MFSPSLFTGQLIERFGEERVTVVGFVLIVASAGVALIDVSLASFWGCLDLLGVGWNLSVLGATSMVVGCCESGERARAQGLNDFLVFGTGAVASLSASGFLQPVGGWSTIAWVAIAPVSIMIARFSYAIRFAGSEKAIRV